MNKLLTEITSADIRHLLFYLYLSIPLFFIPNEGYRTTTLRLILIMACALIAVAVPKIRVQTIISFKKKPKINLLLFVVALLMLISSLFTDKAISVRIIGDVPDYIGIVFWVSTYIIALAISSELKYVLFSKPSMIILALVLGISLFTDKFYILNGFRIDGLLMQSTSMSLYALFALIIASTFFMLSNKQPSDYLLSSVVASMALPNIILSQSRIGILGLIVALGLLAIIFARNYITVSKQFVGITAIVATLVVLMGTSFSRFKLSSIEFGISYRLDIYLTSLRDLLNNNLFIGNGAGSLPLALNDRSTVPPDILATLNKEYTFSSAHNLFLDFGNMFGLIATSIILYLIGAALFTNNSSKNLRISVLKVCLFVLVLNALFNVSQIELTSFLIIITFALLYDDQNIKQSN